MNEIAVMSLNGSTRRLSKTCGGDVGFAIRHSPRTQTWGLMSLRGSTHLLGGSKGDGACDHHSPWLVLRLMSLRGSTHLVVIVQGGCRLCDPALALHRKWGLMSPRGSTHLLGGSKGVGVCDRHSPWLVLRLMSLRGSTHL